MKTLTVQQPYASMIADGEKWVENRMWNTWHRGPLAIHAGLRSHYLDAKELAKYPTGVVVAVVELVACVHLKPIAQIRESIALERLQIDVDEFLAHEHTEGPWCWILWDRVKLMHPVPAEGKQGLWNWHGLSAPVNNAASGSSAGGEGE